MSAPISGSNNHANAETDEEGNSLQNAAISSIISVNIAGFGQVLTYEDGGGPACISQLRLMGEFISRLEHDIGLNEGELAPSDYFDWMGGVGWGAYCALLLGRLHLNTEQAAAALVRTALAVFPSQQPIERNHRTNILRLTIEQILAEYNCAPDMKLFEDEKPSCRVVVFVANTRTMGFPTALHSYRARGQHSTCTFVEAACAAIANPEHFESVRIASLVSKDIVLATVQFAGTPLGFNNPMQAVIREAETCYQHSNAKVALFLSLGCGESAHYALDPIAPQTRGGLSARYIWDCEREERLLDYRSPENAAYLRLSVTRGLEDVSPVQWDQDALGVIETYTKAYLDLPATSRKIDQALNILRSRAELRSQGSASWVAYFAGWGKQ